MADDDGARAGTREEEGSPWQEPARWARRHWRTRGGKGSSGSGSERSGVRHQWLLQFGGHAGENARGKWGGASP
jgi:hypothetical protein